MRDRIVDILTINDVMILDATYGVAVGASRLQIIIPHGPRKLDTVRGMAI